MAARPHVARRILVYWMDAVIAFVAIASLLNLLTLLALEQVTPLQALIAGLLQVLVYAGFPWTLRVAFDNKPAPVALLTLMSVASLAVTLLFPADGYGAASWDILPWFVLSAVGLFLRLRVTLAIGAVMIGLFTVVMHLRTGEAWWWLLTLSTIMVVFMVYGMWLWLWLWRTIREAYESKEAKASLAVAEERLRFSRDLHDLLGRSLVLLSLRSELAAKLGSTEEMLQVHRLAGEALSQLHVTATGLSALDLEEELAQARAALAGVGADCLVQATTAELPAASRALLAWVVREGTTNILKHSSATRCHIRLDAGRLEIRNDGVRHATQAGGSGLHGLAERISVAGGSLDAHPVGRDEFLLTATVPA
ncbi:MAG: hypothetical protein HOV86_10390 [Thermoactinospora sp.]|nr:hypothetical protein [Thermoactinospora sp.]